MKKGCAIMGVFTGAVAVILALVLMFNYDPGSSSSYYTYGGDAYTGIQNSAAKAANNVMDLAEITQFGLFSILLTFGLACICYFAPKAMEGKQESAVGIDTQQVPSAETTADDAAEELPKQQEETEPTVS